MGRVLTESEVQTIGEAYGISIVSNKCCTTAVAATLNCSVTDPSSPSYNQLICAVKKIYTYYLYGADSITTSDTTGTFGGESRRIDSSNNTTFAPIGSATGYGNVTVTSISNSGTQYYVNFTLTGNKKGYIIITQQISGKTHRVSVNGG